MPAYRIYELEDGHIGKAPAVIHCSNDDEAMAKASALAPPGHVVEIWQGGRRVGAATKRPKPFFHVLRGGRRDDRPR